MGDADGEERMHSRPCATLEKQRLQHPRRMGQTRAKPTIVKFHRALDQTTWFGTSSG